MRIVNLNLNYISTNTSSTIIKTTGDTKATITKWGRLQLIQKQLRMKEIATYPSGAQRSTIEIT